MNRHAKAVVAISALLLTLAIGVGAALALQTHKEGTAIDPSSDNPGGEVPNYANNGGFGTLSGLAVDGGNGDLYAVDTAGAGAPVEGTGAVHRFDNAGTRIDTVDGSATATGSLSLFDPADVAVDSSGTGSDGNFYVTDPGNNLVHAFDSSGAPIASFGDSEPADGLLRGTKTPTGGFSTPCGVAVDQSTGNLFVADQNNSKILIFDSTGEYLARIADSTLQGPCGLAFDPSGELYVRNSFNGNVLKFHRSGPTDYDFTQVFYAQNSGTPENGEDDGPYATDVAVDLTTERVYVGLGDRIGEYESWGGEVMRFGQGTLGSTTALAVDGAAGRIYVSDGTTLRVFGTATTTFPNATTGAAEGITGETATVNGTVDPEFGPEAECAFEYGPDESYGSTAPCEPAGPFAEATEVHADLTGLSPGTTYHYRLHATSSETPPAGVNGADRSFATDGAPIVGSFSVADVTSDSAVLKAQVNPAGAVTSYRFEYVTEVEFETNQFTNAVKVPTPDGSIPSGNTGVSVNEAIAGLSSATRYRFRVVAANAVDATQSADKSFETFAVTQFPEQGAFPGQGFLPNSRAWELVSPPDKNGSDVMVETTRVRASADGEAIAFGSLGAFADVVGTGHESEYISHRTGGADTNGWDTHAITPPQQPLTYQAEARSLKPHYEAFSSDLAKGVFLAWSPLTDSVNTSEVHANLYVRDDLQEAGGGSYRLLSDAAHPLSASQTFQQGGFAAGSADFEHLLFETKRPLLSPGEGSFPKLYKYDGQGPPRLLTVGPNCPGGGASPTPCSGAGLTRLGQKETEGAISADGSRVQLTAPVRASGGLTGSAGAVSRLFQLDDQGTPVAADDALIQVNASEKGVPDPTLQAQFGDADSDASRIFFSSAEQLTNAPGGGIYLWERQDDDEIQELSIDAEGGTFTITAHTQPTLGIGDLTNGSKKVSGVSEGSFMVGQTVSGTGIPAGTTITATGSFAGGSSSKTLSLSNPATASGAEVAISADVEATTGALPYDAGADQVESALEGLADPEGRRLLGAGNVSVTGGPGGAGAATPYQVSFVGALHGVNVLPLTVNSSLLNGAGAVATVSTTTSIHNLTLLAPTGLGTVTGTIGVSSDGHRAYLSAANQLVPGGPEVTQAGIYYWQDVGAPGGSLSFVGQVSVSSAQLLVNFRNSKPSLGRVTPSGRALLFTSENGTGLSPGYDHGVCEESPVVSGRCAELYLYRADSSSPLEPDLRCVSCNPTGAPATSSAWVHRRIAVAGAPGTYYLSRTLSADGRYAFFSTAEKLVPADINGLEDAYMYDVSTEEPHLLSSGESSSPSYFADASADGSTAFILTREQLSDWDVDDLLDVYAVRINGGLPEPPPPSPSCQGDACQPAPTQPVELTPASSGFAGPGNRRGSAASRCRAVKRVTKARGKKKRCVKKKRRRATKSDRRAGR